MSIITKIIKDEICERCEGKKIIRTISFLRGKLKQNWTKCQTCDGTGRFVEKYSYYIDDNQKIAFDGEEGK
jgi:DnaJ-class molecular chaperone